jgi:hypothetical protein
VDATSGGISQRIDLLRNCALSLSKGAQLQRFDKRVLS